jgi:hypothetical protein
MGKALRPLAQIVVSCIGHTDEPSPYVPFHHFGFTLRIAHHGRFAAQSRSRAVVHHRIVCRCLVNAVVDRNARGEAAAYRPVAPPIHGRDQGAPVVKGGEKCGEVLRTASRAVVNGGQRIGLADSNPVEQRCVLWARIEFVPLRLLFSAQKRETEFGLALIPQDVH